MKNNELVRFEKNHKKLFGLWVTSLMGAFLAGYALNGSSTGFSIMAALLVIIGFITVTRWWWKLTKLLLATKSAKKEVA